MSLAAIAALMLQPLAPPQTAAFREQPCTQSGLVPDARCGTVTVLENRSLGRGRVIELNVVVIPAQAPVADLPPLFDLDGGPGLHATKNADFYTIVGAAHRARRDVILIDQRGTGRSNRLGCPELESPEAADRPIFPVEQVMRCRSALETRADLSQYGTDAAAADLDAVRAALGHPRIDIVALSYGTTVALRYMSDFPDRVRSAVLFGTAPPDAMPPRHHAAAGERAFTLLLEDCAAQPRCRSAFPNPAGDLDRALARLGTGPDGLSRERFMERLRSLMYGSSGARRIPWIIHRAAQGDLDPFHAATRQTSPSLIADGMFLSVICAESMARFDYEEAARLSRATRFGDYRLRRQRDACEHWPRGRTGPDRPALARSNAALLLISGRLDPVTPPEWAEAVAVRHGRAAHIVIPAGGHILDGLSNLECIDGLVADFFNTLDLSPDTTCLSQVEAPPFATGSDQAEPG